MKNKGLGRGLSAIFEDNSYEEKKNEGKVSVPLALIDINPSQPRKKFAEDAIKSLAQSIRDNGLLQPVLLRRKGERYEIVAGERRFRACSLLGMAEIPANVIDADDFTAAKLALIENMQREDLNPSEEAAAYRDIISAYNLTQEQLAELVGKSRSAVSNTMRLLELPDNVMLLVENGVLTEGHARALLGLTDKTKMLSLAEKIHTEGLSVRGAEELVKTENRRTAEQLSRDKIEKMPVKVDYLRVIEERFTGITGRRCRISENKGVKTFQLEYRDNSDLEEILKRLAGDGIFDDM